MITTSGKNTEGDNACVSQSGDEEGKTDGTVVVCHCIRNSLMYRTQCRAEVVGMRWLAGYGAHVQAIR